MTDAGHTPGRLLIVFGKLPVPGYVKTRLTNLLSPEDAARVYYAFIEDGIARLKSLGVPLAAFVDGKGNVNSEAYARADEIYKQEGANLGAKMSNAFDWAFGAGFRTVVLTGTDHPNLPVEHVALAFKLLEETTDIVLGPAKDGGYYLVGLRRPNPGLFIGMHYSHEKVLEQTLLRADRIQGAEARLLPEWYDVDTPAELVHLAMVLAAVPGHCPATWRVINALSIQYPELRAAISGMRHG